MKLEYVRPLTLCRVTSGSGESVEAKALRHPQLINLINPSLTSRRYNSSITKGKNDESINNRQV